MQRERELLIRPRAVTNPSNTVRVVVMGSPSVGKTAVINGYMREKLSTEHSSAVNSMLHENKDRLKLEIIDTDGILVTSIRNLAIRTAHAFVLVYAVDDEESFDYITELRTEIQQMKGDVPIIVVGNKVDTENRRVHPVVADCVVSIDWDCQYFEVCANDNFNISGIFSKLLSHERLDGLFANISPRTRRASLPNNSLMAVKRQFENPLQEKRSFLQNVTRMFNFRGSS